MHPEHHAEIEQQKSRYTCGKWNILVFFLLTAFINGSKGWRSRESARLPPMWPWFKSRRWRHMWVEFVVGSLLCSERFFSWYSGFSLSSKTNISNFQFDQESGDEEPLCGCVISKSLFIFLFIHLFIATIPVIAVSNFQNLHYWAFSLFCEMSITFPLLALMNANDTRFYLKTQGVQ